MGSCAQPLARGDGAALEVVRQEVRGASMARSTMSPRAATAGARVRRRPRHCVHFLVPLRAPRRWRFLGRGVAALLALHVRAVERMYQPGGVESLEAAALLLCRRQRWWALCGVAGERIGRGALRASA